MAICYRYKHPVLSFVVILNTGIQYRYIQNNPDFFLTVQYWRAPQPQRNGHVANTDVGSPASKRALSCTEMTTDNVVRGQTIKIGRNNRISRIGEHRTVAIVEGSGRQILTYLRIASICFEVIL